MSGNKNKIIFLSLVFIGLLFSALSVSAAELKYTFPCSPIAGGTCPTAEQAAQSPAAYIARFYQFALMISGALAFGMIIFGAIQYVVSAGNAASQKDAADRISQALWGIALLFGAYLILYTIDPKLVSLTDPNITKVVVPIFSEPTQTSSSSNISLTPPPPPPATPQNQPATQPVPVTMPQVPTQQNLTPRLLPPTLPPILPTTPLLIPKTSPAPF